MKTDIEKIEDLEKIYQEERVCLIAGTINATGKTLYWIDNEGLTLIGSYAIVENANGYDLVKVVGKTETTKKDVVKFSSTSYKNMKKVIRAIAKSTVENEDEI